MKNLQEREDAMLHNPDAGVPIMQRYLRCPYNNNNCLQNGCAHYNPDTDECIHVEAAQAQVAIAKALLPVAAAKESEQTGDMQQATKWLEQGKRVRRLAWASDCYLAYILGDGIKIVLHDVPGRWQPLLSELCATDWMVVKK